MSKKPTKQELIDHVESLVAKCEELTRERDEARRETCYELSGWKQSTHEQEARAEAERRGWDCFKEITNG